MQPESADCLEDVPEKSIKKEAVRHAEKPRTASHPLADVVAGEVLRVWRGFSEGVEGQTCVAGVVLVKSGGECVCVSMGQGTKFLPVGLVGDDGERLRDCHAEVLAKRGFKKWLRDADRHEELKDAKVAFYCSSAPCGNSCVKKWSKNSKLNVDSIPHPVFNPSARDVGQTAVTIKGEHIPSSHTPNPPNEGLRSWAPLSKLSVPIGTTPWDVIPLEDRGKYTASCSDKMATWCAVGLQGSVAEGGLMVFPDIVVVGRKFGDATLRRALCCRMASKAFKDHVHHPLIYRTSLQLDDAVYQETEGATFSAPTCSWWIPSMPSPEVLDGTTGLTLASTPSLLSRHVVYNGHPKPRHPTYDRVKSFLYTDKKLLQGYPWRARPDQKRKREEVEERK